MGFERKSRSLDLLKLSKGRNLPGFHSPALAAAKGDPPSRTEARGVAYEYDAVIVGSGPNGLAAAITLAKQGLKVMVLEGASTPGGGMRTQELTLPGFRHDVCSAIHPMALASPFFQGLHLERFGLEWIHPERPVAHPLDGSEAVFLQRSVFLA